MHPTIGSTLTILLLCAGLPASAWSATDIQLLYIGAKDDSAYLGVMQGLNEANLQGQFLGQKYIINVRAPGALPADVTVGTAAILAAVNATDLPALATAANGVPVFNLRAPDDSLRAACSANLLHVIPSEAMVKDAVAQWRKANPGAQVTARAWHGDFMKYAGRDLNKRFRATHNQPMDDFAWAGWAAVKMTSDTIARLNDAKPAALLTFLRQELKFDGQKGAEMTFRDNGQLRQPLLLIDKDEIAGEAPVRGVAAADDLDSLGNNNSCSQEK